MGAKMYSLIEDNVEKFYTIAEDKVGECEHVSELYDHMKKHTGLLASSSDEDNWEEGLDMLWNEYWSKYQ
jgi:hypothetical protein